MPRLLQLTGPLLCLAGAAAIFYAMTLGSLFGPLVGVLLITLGLGCEALADYRAQKSGRA